MSLRARSAFSVALLCAAGIAYRLVYVFDQVGRIDGDNAVVGLMARHILAGRHYAFFWGQAYLGTLEPYSIAAAAAVLGLNDLVLRGVPLVYGSLYMASFYWLGRRLYDPTVGIVTLALAALCPPLLAVWSSSPRGGYTAALLLGQLVLLVALWLAARRPRRWGVAPAAALGVLGGVALWTHFLSVSFLLVAVLVLLRADPTVWRRGHTAVAAGAFLLGALPLWVYNLTAGFPSLALLSAGGGEGSIHRSLHDLLVLHGPKILGVRDLVGDQQTLLGGVGGFVGIVSVAGLFWSVARALAAAHRPGPPGGGVCVLLLAVVLGLDLFTRYGTWNTERYLLPAYSAILPLLAAAWVDLGRRSRAAVAVVTVAALAVFTAGAVSLDHGLRTGRPEPYDPEAVAFLEAQGIRHGFADHADALVTTYRSQERVVLLDTGVARYPVTEIDDWRPRAILAPAGRADVGGALDALGCRFERRTVGRYEIYYDVDPRFVGGKLLERVGWRVTASPSPGEAVRAIDGDLASRWASHSPQRPGMRFEIALGRRRIVAGVRLLSYGFPIDFPRGLRVEGLRESEPDVPLAELAATVRGMGVVDGHVYFGPHSFVEVRFAPIEVDGVRLVQTGSDPRVDWSITEIEMIDGREEEVPVAGMWPHSPTAMAR